MISGSTFYFRPLRVKWKLKMTLKKTLQNLYLNPINRSQMGLNDIQHEFIINQAPFKNKLVLQTISLKYMLKLILWLMGWQENPYNITCANSNFLCVPRSVLGYDSVCLSFISGSNTNFAFCVMQTLLSSDYYNDSNSRKGLLKH